MKRLLCYLIIGILLLGLLPKLVKAQDTDEESPVDDSSEDDEPETRGTSMKASPLLDESEAEGISTHCIFPHHRDRTFPAGEVIESLIGFENQNDEKLHIEYIRGSLTSPVDFTYYIQNFTGAMHNTTATPGDEVCLLYRFRADPSLEPRQYGLILQVFYTSDDNETFLSTVYNGTVDISDASSTLDGQSVFAYLTVLGMLGIAVYAGLTMVKKSPGKRSSRSPTASNTSRTSPTTSSPKEEPSDGIDWDFISEEQKRLLSRKRGGRSPPRRTSPPRES